MTNILTPQDLATLAPDIDTSAYSATIISGIIVTAQDRMSSFCNVKGFEFQAEFDSDRAKINNRGELVISVRRRPIVSVESIVLKRGGFSTSLVLTASDGTPLYNIPDVGNRIHFPNAFLYATGTYLAGGASQLLTLKSANMFCEINYHGGLQVIPPDLKDALLLYVQDFFARSANRIGAQSYSQGSVSVNFGSGSNIKGASIAIQQANAILTQGGYVRPELF